MKEEIGALKRWLKIIIMLEDEFQKKLEQLKPKLKDEQIKLLYKIRGDGNNDKPNN